MWGPKMDNNTSKFINLDMFEACLLKKMETLKPLIDK